MTDMKLDLDELSAEFRASLDETSAYKMERLLHTYVANPMSSVFMQIEIMKRLLERDPATLAGEVENLQKQVRLASDNIVTVVKALAAAFPKYDDE